MLGYENKPCHLQYTILSILCQYQKQQKDFYLFSQKLLTLPPYHGRIRYKENKERQHEHKRRDGQSSRKSEGRVEEERKVFGQ